MPKKYNVYPREYAPAILEKMRPLSWNPREYAYMNTPKINSQDASTPNSRLSHKMIFVTSNSPGLEAKALYLGA